MPPTPQENGARMDSSKSSSIPPTWKVVGNLEEWEMTVQSLSRQLIWSGSRLHSLCQKGSWTAINFNHSPSFKWGDLEDLNWWIPHINLGLLLAVTENFSLPLFSPSTFLPLVLAMLLYRDGIVTILSVIVCFLFPCPQCDRMGCPQLSSRAAAMRGSMVIKTPAEAALAL